MKKIMLFATLAIPAISTTVASQDNDPDWTVDGYVGLTSDYRDRGVSMADRDPTIFGSFGIFHKSGFYGGVDAALIDDGVGGDQKTEFFLGYSTDKGDFVYDFSVELDGIHGDTSDYYSEFKASVSRDFGLAFFRTGLAYAPEGRWNTPGVDSLYGYTDIEVPVPTIPELTLVTHVGYDLRDDRSNLWDWSVGFSAFIDSFEVTLTFEDSSLDSRLANGQFLLATKFYF